MSFTRLCDEWQDAPIEICWYVMSFVGLQPRELFEIKRANAAICYVDSDHWLCAWDEDDCSVTGEFTSLVTGEIVPFDITGYGGTVDGLFVVHSYQEYTNWYDLRVRAFAILWHPGKILTKLSNNMVSDRFEYVHNYTSRQHYIRVANELALGSTEPNAGDTCLVADTYDGMCDRVHDYVIYRKTLSPTDERIVCGTLDCGISDSTAPDSLVENSNVIVCNDDTVFVYTVDEAHQLSGRFVKIDGSTMPFQTRTVGFVSDTDGILTYTSPDNRTVYWYDIGSTGRPPAEHMIFHNFGEVYGCGNAGIYMHRFCVRNVPNENAAVELFSYRWSDGTLHTQPDPTGFVPPTEVEHPIVSRYGNLIAYNWYGIHDGIYTRKMIVCAGAPN